MLMGKIGKIEEGGGDARVQEKGGMPGSEREGVKRGGGGLGG